jgi:hypothetical protein
MNLGVEIDGVNTAFPIFDFGYRLPLSSKKYPQNNPAHGLSL